MDEELYEGALDVDEVERRWGNPDRHVVGTLYTAEQCAQQSTIDVPALIEDVRRARVALSEARSAVSTSGDSFRAAAEAAQAENEALRQANADAREKILALREELAGLREA